MVWSSPDKIGRDFERRPVASAIKWAIIAIIVILGLVALVWGITTGWSYWQGRGDLVRQHNSSDNFISAQGQFTQENQDYQNFLRVNIPAAKRSLDQFNQAHPTIPGDLSGISLANQQQTLQDNLQGVEAGCAQVAGDYNAQTQNYLSRDFRNANLPPSLDAGACTPNGN
jgi:hypothetical protein